MKCLRGMGLCAALGAVACGSHVDVAFGDRAGTGGSGGAALGTSVDASSSSANGSTSVASTVASGSSAGGSTGSGGGSTCKSGPNDDADGDGFTPAHGDCNDCDPNVNPNAIEVPTPTGPGPESPTDENCNGMIDEPFQPCDAGFALDDPDPMHAAMALDLCHPVTSSEEWGLASAKWVRADGTPTTASAQVGIRGAFGPNVAPRFGAAMIALSSGHARTPGEVGACGTNSCDDGLDGVAPPGFPQPVPNCQVAQDIHDDVGLEIALKAPSNASGYSFDLKFYTFEYPEWVCTNFNDQFIAFMNPTPRGSTNGNVSVDPMNIPVGVNCSFIQICNTCPLGTAELQGTGFDGSWGDDAGATPWLTTTAPVKGGDEFTLRFAIWDSGDHGWDSTVLLDHFEWIANSATITVATAPAN